MEINDKAYELCNDSSSNSVFILSSFIIKILVKPSEQALENVVLLLGLSSCAVKLWTQISETKEKKQTVSEKSLYSLYIRVHVHSIDKRWSWI